MKEADVKKIVRAGYAEFFPLGINKLTNLNYTSFIQRIYIGLEAKSHLPGK